MSLKKKRDPGATVILWADFGGSGEWGECASQDGTSSERLRRPVVRDMLQGSALLSRHSAPQPLPSN